MTMSKRTVQPRRITRLGVHLLEHGIEQQKLAKATGIHPLRLSRIVRGVSEPRADEKKAIGDALGCQMHVLFDAFSHLDDDMATVERLCAFLRTPEGGLFVRRLKEVVFSVPRGGETSPHEGSAADSPTTLSGASQ